MPKWTEEQKQAIYEKGSNLLVAAAAGSGKTAVLVERIINKVMNENIDIDRLLVVTFTNAAAAEMRERVLDAIYKKLEEEPENEKLQKQLMLLNMASICTIDSFCLEIVKNNFYELENVSPNFRIADTPEIELLKQELLDELFEKKYEEENEDFVKLVSTYTNYRDDTPLKDLILKIYNYISSSPYPKEWLHEKIEMFNLKDKINRDFSETLWGKILLQDLKEELEDDITVLKGVQEDLSFDEELEPFRQIVESDVKQLQTLKSNLDNWDNAYQISQNIKFMTWSRKKVESEIKDEAKKIRDSVKDKFGKKVNKILISNSNQANQDIYDMYDILKKLENLILEFDNIFNTKKREKNIVDFTDIEHFALEILLKKDETGKIQKTEVAKRYTEKFEEIAIDEYQDSNLVQEYILSSISRGNNQFMVGDVKQSIYRFRQAMPKLFLDKYSKFWSVGTDVVCSKDKSEFVEEYEKIQEETKSDKNDRTKLDCPHCPGRKIQLYKNFRSRANVLDFTNFVFQDIMSEVLGEVEYNKNEYLNFGAEDYKCINQNFKTEIDIINTKAELQDDDNKNTIEDINSINGIDSIDGGASIDADDFEHLEEIELEAKYVANRIQELIKTNYQVYDRKSGEFRNIKYRDIAILLRSTKEKASIYEQELMNLEIPVFSDSTQEYLDSIEIQTIMSVLKIIDNPIQDIPLVTVMRSPIGGFTDNDLIEIRLVDKQDDFYHCLLKSKINTTDKLRMKITKFLDNLDNWREEQEYLALDELIWKIYTDTGYYHYVGLMPNGNIRQANLKMLFERAKGYETASFKGLYNFIHFIEKLKINSGDLGSAKIIGENDDVVRIMSIHKSKGLEFPIVFLVNSNKQCNEQETKLDSVLLHQDIGIGVKYIDYYAQIKYDTLTREAIKNKLKNENLSEEMRILYVALTRAKEKLIITGTSKDFENKLEKMEKQIEIYPKEKQKINPILIKKYKSFLDWILLVYLYEKEKANKLAEIKEINPKDIIEKEAKKEEQSDLENIMQELENAKDNFTENEYERLKSKIEYEYEHQIDIKLPTKISVTQIKQIQQEKNKLKSQKNDANLIIDNQKLIDCNEQTNIKDIDITFEKPKLLQTEEKEISAAEKGTLVHLCLQKLDIKERYDIDKIKLLINELENNEIITSNEAKTINPYKILEFTKSKLWEMMQKSKEIYREKPFYINIPAQEIYEEETEQNILVQGIIDLYFINEDDDIILVDYKTDYVENNQENKLIEKYEKQLEIYKRALEQTYNKKVKKIYIYSVYMSKTIEI